MPRIFLLKFCLSVPSKMVFVITWFSSYRNFLSWGQMEYLDLMET